MTRRRPFTLIELLIAVSLSVVLLTTLFGFYRYLATSGADLAEKRQETFLQRLVQNRLTFTLMNARSDGDKTIFYIDESENEEMRAGSLLFVFDREADLRPELSHLLLTRLYLDDYNRVCLAYWPQPTEYSEVQPPFRYEVLLEEVDELRFRFFAAPVLDGEAIAEDVSVPTPGEWQEEWSSEFKELPALTEVIIEHKGETFTFSFPMLYCKKQIHYRR